jgi:lambda family phage tail tape measure protein
MDIASLGLRIDSSGVQEGISGLDALSASAAKAEASVTKLGESEDQAASRIKAMVQASLQQKDAALQAASALDQATQKAAASSAAVMSSRKADTLGESFAMQTRELAALNSALANHAQSLSDIGELTEWVSELNSKGLLSEEEMVDAMARIDAQEKTLTKTMAQHAAAVQKLVDSYDPASAALKNLANDEKLLNDALKSGAITAEQHTKAVNGIAVNKAKWQAEALAVNEVSTKLKGMSFTSSYALREYTAMMNGLASGNLGQVAREMATLGMRTGSFALLLNPVAIGIAAVVAGLGTFAAAELAGEKENFAFAKSIELTGNYAGMTTGQLQLMAKSIGQIGGSRASAAETLALFNSTGEFKSDQLEKFVTLAESLKSKVGQPVADTLKIFQELGQSPVEASAKLNKQYGYLTESVFKQILALQQQGKLHEAAALAQNAYADAAAKTGDHLVEQLGTMQRAAKATGGFFKDMWNDILGIGRPKTDEETLADLVEKRGSRKLGETDSWSRSGANQQKADDEHEKALRVSIDYQKQLADQKAKQTEQDKLGIENDQKQVAATKEMQSYLASLAGVKEAGSLAAIARGLSKEQQVYAQADTYLEMMHSQHLINDKDYYAGKVDIINRGAEAEKQAIDAEIKAINAAQAKAQAMLNAKGNLTPEERAAQQHQVDLQEAAGVNKIIDLQAKKQAITAEAANKVVVEGMKESKAAKDIADGYDSAREAAQSYLDVINKQRQRELDGVGKGNKQRAYDQGQNAIDDRFISEKKKLDDQQRLGQITKQQYAELLSVSQEFRAQDQSGFDQYWTDLNAKQGEWQNGFGEAFANFRDEAGQSAKHAEELFTNAFSAMNDGLAHFVATGKGNFGDFVKTVLEGLIKLQLQAIESKLFQMIAMTGVSIASPTSAGAMAGGTDGISSAGSGAMLVANGAAFDGGKNITAFANGGIVDKPTGFTYGGGKLGVMGEAGTEAIMPLTRASNGKLGVRASGGGSNVVNINSTINMESGTNVAQFQSMLDERDERLKADFADGMRRGRYGNLSRSIGQK